MKAATVLIIMLSHGGYWLSGHSQSLTLQPATGENLPAADLSWSLILDGVQLHSGKTHIRRHDPSLKIPLDIPAVRVRLTLHWKYRLLARDGGAELETGDVPIEVFPDDLLAGLTDRVGKQKIVVLDEPEGLPRILDLAKVPFTRVANADKLKFADCDMVLVGEGMLTHSPFEQAPLLNLAKAGTSVMIFRQTRPDALLGYTLSLRDTPEHLDWKLDHPLLAGLTMLDVQSWLAGERALTAIQLPADEPALEIASFPPEVPTDKPRPIDALLLSKSVEKGRVVLCQLPLGKWDEDPRSQILLANALNYLLTRPQPTPRPSERTAIHPANPIPARIVEVPIGLP